MEFQRPPYGMVKGNVTFPNPSQMTFHSSRKSFKLFRAGVGSGKTHAGVEEMIGKALANGPNKLYIVGAPSHPILKLATFPAYVNALKRWHSHNGRRLTTKITRSDSNRSITLRGNIVFQFICLKNPDDFAGPTIAGFHVDEAALLENGMAAHGMLTERLRDANAKELFGIYTTTPRGPVGIIHHFAQQLVGTEFKHGIREKGDYAEIVSKTHENLHNLGEGFLSRTMAGKSDRQIRQQLHAEVLDFAGAVYSGAFTMQSFATARDPFGRTINWNKDHLKGKQIYLAIDWGPQYPHVLWIAHDSEKDTDVVFDELCEDNIGHQELLERAMAQGLDKWGIEKRAYAGIYADRNPASANRIARQFFSSTRGSIQVYGKTVKNNDAVLDGIDVVTARLWSPSDNMRRLFFAPHLQKAREKRSIIQCMRLYKWKQRNVSSSTVYDIVAEKGVYDHGPDALRYYCWRRYLTQRFDSATAASIAERQENYAMGRAA